MKLFQMIDNVVTFGIMVFIMLLATFGIITIVNGILLGLIPIGLALAMIYFGWTDHGFIKDEKDKKEVLIVGFLTYFGSAIKIGGECVTVNCSVILAPWIGISSIKVDMTPKTINRTVNALSLEMSDDGRSAKARIQVPIDVSVTFEPDIKNLDKFQKYGNGKTDKIEKDVAGIITVETEAITKTLSVYQMAEAGKSISTPLERSLIPTIAAKPFGITVNQVQAECKVPDTIANSAMEVLKAENESKARVRTAEGLHSVTTNILAQGKADPDMTYIKAHQLAIEASLLEDEKLNRDQIEVIAPKGTTVNFFGPVGGKNQQQKKGGNP